MAGISRNVLIIIIVAGLLIVGIQIWGNIEISRHSGEIMRQIESLPQDQLAGEKERQEVIALSIETETKALFWTGLAGSVGTLVAVFVALFGIWQGLRDYWVNREKERLDRAATDLNGIWEGLANNDARVRAGAIVGLQHYLTPDKSEYHARILSALMVEARLEQEPEVLNIITVTIQQGMKQVPWEIAHQISWQRVNLKGINMAGLILCGFDFRDANLEDADLQGCNLSGALFNAANLKGARLDGSILTGANLEYADLAGASLVHADLTECNLNNAKVLNADLKLAILNNAKFDPEEINWRLTRNWRLANLGDALHDRLIKRYGPVAGGTKVLMMLWEFPPFVAGGAWTAAYHILRNLRRQGANLVVMVPWKRSELNLSIFGNEVEFVTLEITPPGGTSPSGGQEGMSVYVRPYPVYGVSSPYQRSYRTYDRQTSVYDGKTRLLRGGPIGGMVREFQHRALRYVQRRSNDFDIVYASDWPTFWAAEEVSRATGKPWVAHFHSTENDRRPQDPDKLIVAIERRGAVSAGSIVTPSKFTAGDVSRLYGVPYGVPDSKIRVMPNPLSEDDIPVSELGSYDTKRVIFVGRLAGQKGPELFVETCKALKQILPASNFAMFTDNEEYSEIRQQIDNPRLDIQYSGFVDWESRGTAFGNASALLVPSRAEPFGMVILEGMERGVPVLYPEQAGASEVLTSGIKINPERIQENAEELKHLLSDRNYWEKIVEEQNAEIRSYYSRGYERVLMQLFSEVSHKPGQGSPANGT